MLDLLEYLYEEYKKAVLKELVPVKAGPIDTLETFLKFSKDHLRGNPPVAVMTVASGLGMRLMDTTEVSIVSQPEEKRFRESIPITNPGFNPVSHGISSIEATQIAEAKPRK
jgi:hypothetical protein